MLSPACGDFIASSTRRRLAPNDGEWSLSQKQQQTLGRAMTRQAIKSNKNIFAHLINSIFALDVTWTMYPKISTLNAVTSRTYHKFLEHVVELLFIARHRLVCFHWAKCHGAVDDTGSDVRRRSLAASGKTPTQQVSTGHDGVSLPNEAEGNDLLKKIIELKRWYTFFQAR